MSGGEGKRFAVVPGQARAELGWTIERRRGIASHLVGSWPEAGRGSAADATVAICSVIGPPTLVLGSTQAVALRAERLKTTTPERPLGHAQSQAGDRGGRTGEPTAVQIVERRSGGGSVWVAPGQQVWIDVWLPAGHRLWDPDVATAAHWIGEAWASALDQVAVGNKRAPISVHRAGLVAGKWSRQVCFAGLGPGEVSIGSKKIVGLAQRRTGAGAWFHSMALWRWDPQPIIAGLVQKGLMSPHDQVQATAELISTTTDVSEIMGLAESTDGQAQGQALDHLTRVLVTALVNR